MQSTSLSEFKFVNVGESNKSTLGTGSFGEVRLARHIQSNKLFALKIMNVLSLKSQAEIDGIDREIRCHKQLNHDNIVRFYCSFKEGNNIVMVLEYVQNGSLYSRLQKKKYFCEDEAFKFFQSQVKAIMYLHQCNFMHRDIKPENIILDGDLRAKLCDFGWCADNINLKRSTFCGTYEYMAPEIVNKQMYDFKIDIWSLGILLYELTHGYSPFKGLNFQEISTKIKNYNNNLNFNDQVSFELKQLISSILKKDPRERISLSSILDAPWMKKMQGRVQNNRELQKSSSSNVLPNFTRSQTQANFFRKDENLASIHRPKKEERIFALEQPKFKQDKENFPQKRTEIFGNLTESIREQNQVTNMQLKINIGTHSPHTTVRDVYQSPFKRQRSQLQIFSDCKKQINITPYKMLEHHTSTSQFF